MSAERLTMRRISLLILCVAATIGCHRATNSSTATSSALTPLTPEQMAKKKIPVLARTIGQQELDQLYKFVNQFHAEHGKYPTTFQELGIDRDLPKVSQAVQSGELVYVGGTGGVLAYEKAALTDRGNVLTTNGVQVMTADELKKLLGR
jgi:ABC-type glycerol-3-phosphate transport system substrate-binding protein